MNHAAADSAPGAERYAASASINSLILFNSALSFAGNLPADDTRTQIQNADKQYIELATDDCKHAATKRPNAK